MNDDQWEQKFAALQAISSDISLRMRRPGNWYVSMRGVEVGGNGLLTSITQTDCTSPFDAIHTC